MSTDDLRESPQIDLLGRLQLLLDMHQLVEVVLALDVLAQVVIARQQLADPGQALGHHIEYRALVGTRQLLRQLADLQRRRAPDLAVIGHLLALDV